MDEIENTVTEVVQRHISQEALELSPDQALLELGSLEVVTMICDLEATMSIHFPAEMLDRDNFASISSISAAVKKLLYIPPLHM